MKFFRNLRKRLVISGSVKSYLLYAFGEVLLIVLGILLAFQINTWTDEAKARRMERQHLTNLKSEIYQSLQNLDDAIAFQTTTLGHIENIIQHIEKDLPYSQVLDTSFYFYQYSYLPQLSFTTYETIKSVGIHSIHPDSLRQSISELYEEDFSFLSNSIEQTERAFYQNVITPFHLAHFKEISQSRIAIPNDFAALKQNQKFSNIIHKLKGVRQFSTITLQSVKAKTLAVSHQLATRLEEL